MSQVNIKAVLFCLFVFICFPLAGQEISSESESDTLINREIGEVVITAERHPSLQLNTPEAIRVLGSRKISNFQVRTSPEALNLTPGVFVQKTNHGGGSPFLRGLTGNQTLLLVDGIRLSNSASRYGPNQTFNTIDVFGVEKIEVLRGGGSVQYGSDAIGGTVQAFTFQPSFAEKPEWGGSITGRLSTHGMEQGLNSALEYSGKRAAFRASVTGRNFGDLVGGDTTGRQVPTGYKELDYDLKAKFLLARSSELTVAYQTVHQADVPVYHKYVLENYGVNKMDLQDRELGYVRLNQDFDNNIVQSAVLTAFFHNSEEGRELRKNGSNTLRNENDMVNTLGFSGEFLMASSGLWEASSGLELYNDNIASTRTDTDLTSGSSVSKRGLYPDGSSMTSMAAFTLHTFDLDKWSVNAGMRFNSYIINVKDESVGNAKLTPSALVGNLSLLRKLSSRTSAFASVNSGFRAPNIDDLGTLGIVDFRYEVPNYDLKPERSVQYQVGIKHAGQILKGEMYLYRNNLSDLVVRNSVPGDTIDGYPVYIKENVEDAYIQGFETSWDVRINRVLSLNASYTYTYGQNITRNEPVRRIPPMFWRAATEYSSGKWRADIEWMGASKQDRLAAGDKSDNRIPAGGTPGWNIINIGGGYSSGRYAADLSFNNILNADYRYHGSGVNGVGRSLLLTVHINIGSFRIHS
jgi:outer membrane cobalamin receptor